MKLAVLLRKPVALLALVVIFLVAILPMFSSSLGIFDTFNTNGSMIRIDGIDEAHSGWMNATFSKTQYVGSWMPNTDSETISVTGELNLKNWVTGGLTWVLNQEWQYRYTLYQEGNSEPLMKYPPTYTDDSQTWCKIWARGGDAPKPLYAWNGVIKSTADTIRLKLVLDLQWWGNHQGWDGAYLISGIADIYIPQNYPQGPFEEGDTAKVYVKTGYAGTGGWYLKLQPPADRVDLDQSPPPFKTLANNIGGTIIDVAIPAGAFKVGSTNKWEVQLWNSFFNYKFCYVLTIDQLDRAPLLTNITVVNNNVSMTYTVNAVRTYAELSHIEVCAYYSWGGVGMPDRTDTESWILMDKRYEINGGVASFTVFPKNLDGTVIVQVVGYDVDGRPSTPEMVSFIVEQGGTAIGDDPLTQPFLWTWVVLLVVALAALAIMGIWFVFPFPLQARIALTIIVALGAAILAYMAGMLMLGV